MEVKICISGDDERSFQTPHCAALWLRENGYGIKPSQGGHCFAISFRGQHSGNVWPVYPELYDAAFVVSAMGDAWADTALTLGVNCRPVKLREFDGMLLLDYAVAGGSDNPTHCLGDYDPSRVEAVKSAVSMAVAYLDGRWPALKYFNLVIAPAAWCANTGAGPAAC